jgi:hypothetical protein
MLSMVWGGVEGGSHLWGKKLSHGTLKLDRVSHNPGDNIPLMGRSFFHVTLGLALT